MFEEHEIVVLQEDLPDLGLQCGDVGVIVMKHRDGEAYEVEFLTLRGDTVAVATLQAQQIRPVRDGEIAHARALAKY
ncbi:MAG: DUF4926 domain-containing protein [Fimbriimonadales bacterium]|nr:DUF4926 domain-containing protein [Fimbriimonadales bacterium]